MTPDDLQGHWRRAWLKAPGVVDHDTCVHWMQAGRLFADIRIPGSRPETRGAEALADLSDAMLLTLMRAEAFAGEIAVEDEVCTWHRRINWHGATSDVDAGRLSLDDEGGLIETGVGADYVELWHRMDDAADEGLHLEAGDLSAYLVTVGRSFVFVLGQPGATASAPIIDALAAGERGEALARHFDAVCMLGTWERDEGRARLSTNPLLEGQTVLRRTRDAILFDAPDFFGAPRRIDFRAAVTAETALAS